MRVYTCVPRLYLQAAAGIGGNVAQLYAVVSQADHGNALFVQYKSHRRAHRGHGAAIYGTKGASLADGEDSAGCLSGSGHCPFLSPTQGISVGAVGACSVATRGSCSP